MVPFAWPKRFAACLPFYAAALAGAAALKLAYRRAGADDLAWILAPTARLAELLSEMRFEREARSGWISHTDRLILGPGCAGVNFMTIVFLVLCLPLLHRHKSAATRGAWLGASFAASFLLAVAVNALRIVAAARLYEIDLHGWLTPARLHRLLGIVLYAVALLLVYLVADRLVPAAGASRPDRVPAAWVPLAGYAAVTLGVPLAGLAWRRDLAGFSEHAASVLLVCLILAAAAWWVRRAACRREEAAQRGHESRGARC